MSSPLEHSQLISLVLQSKEALQNGEQLCSRAHSVSNASANVSIDVVALDAKVRWVTEAVGEQLKLVASVAKSIEEKRAALSKKVQDWDQQRAKQTDALDHVLESLSSQHVPPDFHQTTSPDSSLFGSQHSDDGRDQVFGSQKPHSSAISALSQTPSSTSTLRGPLRNGTLALKDKKPDFGLDRTMWKTLRDFVDDQAIEDVLESIENDRLRLDHIMGKTDEYPETLSHTIETVQDSLPVLPNAPPIQYTEELLAGQDARITTMASHLESLASHYEQISNALHESEAGGEFDDEDIEAMHRDTNELPSIMAELDESANAIEECK
ncbi:hypothetical protein H0H93_009854 [Arthromyces matolae]|nr:hypothetical protein H0H93_009854 [Arthromyces matolae]